MRTIGKIGTFNMSKSFDRTLSKRHVKPTEFIRSRLNLNVCMKIASKVKGCQDGKQTMEPGFSPLLQEVSRGEGEKPERCSSLSALHQHEPTLTLVEITRARRHLYTCTDCVYRNPSA